MNEAEVRELRRQVFGQDCSDHSWEQVKQNWMRADSVEWLREKAQRPLADYSRGKGTR